MKSIYKFRSLALHIFQNDQNFLQIWCPYYWSILKMWCCKGSEQFSQQGTVKCKSFFESTITFTTIVKVMVDYRLNHYNQLNNYFCFLHLHRDVFIKFQFCIEDHSKFFQLKNMHGMKIVQIRSFFLARIFLHSD